MRSDLIDLTFGLIHETEEAILVLTNRDKEVWLPKSQIEFEELPRSKVRITISEWLATERELV